MNSFETVLKHPAFVAFVVLVAVCAIGVYIIRGAKSGISEGFEEKDEAQIYFRDKLIPTLEIIVSELTKNKSKLPADMDIIKAINDYIKEIKEKNVNVSVNEFRSENGIALSNNEIEKKINMQINELNNFAKVYDEQFKIQMNIPQLPPFAYSNKQQGPDKYQTYAREQLIPTYEKFITKDYRLPGGNKLKDVVITPALFELRNVVPKEGWAQKPEAEKIAYINGEVSKINSYVDRFRPSDIPKLVPMGSEPKPTEPTSESKTEPTPDTSSVAAAAMTGEHAVLNTTLQSILKRLDGLELTKTTPCKASLDIAQGANVVPCKDQLIVDKDALLASYKKHQEKIKPHEALPTGLNIPSLSSKLATDKGTMAETIKAGEYLSPSVRQMIRDDVSKVVREEVDGSYYNPNEVKYGY
jgi:hypothetical protein